MINALLVILAVTIPPAPTNFIHDEAGLLTPAAQAEVQSAMEQVKTTSGATLGLITFKDLDDDPKAVAVRTINFWGMGTRSVVLLISTNPRKIYLQPGDYYASTFSQNTAVGIIKRDIVPTMRSGRYSAGIISGFRSISSALTIGAPVTATLTPVRTPEQAEGLRRSEAAYVESQKPMSKGSIAGWIFGATILFMAVVYSVRRYRKYNKEKAIEEDRYARDVIRENPPRRLYPVTGQGTFSNPTTVVNNNSNNDVLTTVLLVDALRDRTPTVVTPPRTYTPAPTPPRPSPPSRSSYSSRNDDYSSSSSGSSGWGGGGSDWGSSGSDGGSSGGGGGGSDW